MLILSFVYAKGKGGGCNSVLCRMFVLYAILWLVVMFMGPLFLPVFIALLLDVVLPSPGCAC